MSQDLKCFLGCHKFEVLKEEDVKLAGSELVIAKAIISRCSNCGKIKIENVNITTFSY